MMKTRRSPNFDDRSFSNIDILVVHYTGMETANAAINWMCNPESEVSAHYCICENGEVFQLVDEDKRAWHAGLAFWRGARNINARSIGIELANPGHEHGYQAFPEPQIAALEVLCSQILARHVIPAQNIVGHSDIAPRRKLDPGELFPWQRLAVRGIGLWPKKISGNHKMPAVNLHRFGYEIKDKKASIRAFQRHFRPNCINGIWDAECEGLLAGLCLSG